MESCYFSPTIRKRLLFARPICGEWYRFVILVCLNPCWGRDHITNRGKNISLDLFKKKKKHKFGKSSWSSMHATTTFSGFHLSPFMWIRILKVKFSKFSLLEHISGSKLQYSNKILLLYLMHTKPRKQKMANAAYKLTVNL